MHANQTGPSTLYIECKPGVSRTPIIPNYLSVGTSQSRNVLRLVNFFDLGPGFFPSFLAFLRPFDLAFGISKLAEI